MNQGPQKFEINRLCTMDLQAFIKEQPNYVCAIVWRPFWMTKGDVLMVDREASTKGAYVDACAEFRYPAERPGKAGLGRPYADSLPGRALASKDWDWCENIQVADDIYQYPSIHRSIHLS